MDIDTKIRIYAVENAVKFKGKASQGAILGKILGEFKEWRSKRSELMEKINVIVDEVNALDLKSQEAELSGYAITKPIKAEKKGLKELEDASSGVVMRFAPSPSGPMHIGHANTGGVTSLYVEKYGGTFILRIEDTNSSNIYPLAYDYLQEDAEWVFGNVSEVWIQSDRLEIYYRYVEKLISLDAVYVCICNPDSFRNSSKDMKNCPCRSNSVDETLQRWKGMFDTGTYKQGDAVLRFKSDMQHKNPAMRDFPLARINDEEHPRQGTQFRVWPLMNLSVTVDDIEAGMTHIIRGKDHADNALRQELIYKALHKPSPKVYFQGRINFEGLDLSCSKTKKRIEEGEFTGWDDIRLPFLRALKRRGYQPGAFRRYAQEVGFSPVDKRVSADEFFKQLNHFNKEIIDPSAKRFFMIRKPVRIEVHGAPDMDVELDLHPDNMLGGRTFSTKGAFIIELEDHERIASKTMVRLMDCMNIRRDGSSFSFVSAGYGDYKGKGMGIIHWLPDKDHIPIEICMPDGSTLECLAEQRIEGISVGDIIQFERFGFCRLDAVGDGKYTFWFAHK